MFGSERDRNAEGRSPSRLALGSDRAAVQLDQFLHQGQPNATAFVRAPPCILDPVESLEQPRHFGGWNACAGIPHDQFGSPARLLQRDGNLALEGKLEGVGQQVQHHLLPHFPVHEHRLVQRWAIDRQVQAGTLDGRTEHACKIGSEGGEVGRLVDRFDPPRLDTGKVE